MRVCVVSVPERGQRDAVDHERGVRDDQRLPDRPQRDDRVRADPPGHRRRGAERVGPLAEQQLVDDAAEQHAGRVVGRRGERRDQGLRAGVELVGTQGVEQGQREHEERHHRDQRGTVHDRR